MAGGPSLRSQPGARRSVPLPRHIPAIPDPVMAVPLLHGGEMVSKRFVVTALDLLGLNALARPVYAGRGVIVMLHRVLGPGHRTLMPGNALPVELLDRFLADARRRGWAPVTVEEAREAARRPNRRGRVLAITLDDGYRDNLTVARDVFHAHRTPFVVYACVGFADRAATVDVAGAPRVVEKGVLVERLVLDHESVEFPHATTPEPLRCATPDEKSAALDRLWGAFAADPAGAESALQAALASHGMVAADVLADTYLSWDELRALAADPLAEVGSHTLTHRRLSQLPLDEAREELAASKARLERELGTAVRHLAYPYGGPESCGAREYALAEECGYAVAVTTRRGNLFREHGSRPMALPRIGVSMQPHSASPRFVNAVLSGSWTGLANRGRRVTTE